MRSIGDVERPWRELGVHDHGDGTVTVIVRTGTKAAAVLIPLADLTAALTPQENHHV